MEYLEINYLLLKIEDDIRYFNNLKIIDKYEEYNNLKSRLLNSMYICNKLNLFDKRKEIISIIENIGYNSDIALDMVIDKPYLYTNNNDYSDINNLVGEFKRNIMNDNKRFSYRYEYDKYLNNNELLIDNIGDIDLVIRNYKDILLNTVNESIKKMCLDKIYEIYDRNPYKYLIDKRYIEIIENDKIYNNEDLVSIILLSYNHDNYIEDTIKSIYEQDYNNIELIIADDCSRNLDINVLKKIICKYKNDNIKRIVIYRNKVNLGTVSNCNKAICLSSGKYIKFISSDDVFYNRNVISILVNEMILNDYDALESKIEWNDIHMNKIPYEYCPISDDEYLEYFNIITDKNLFLREIFIRNIISAVGVMFLRDIFISKCGMFDEEYLLYEDYPYWIKMAINSATIGCIDIISIKYRYGSGVSTTENTIFGKDRVKFIAKRNALRTKLGLL